MARPSVMKSAVRRYFDVQASLRQPPPSVGVNPLAITAANEVR